MGNGQTERDRQEERAQAEACVDFISFHRAYIILAVVMFLLGFASATGFFYAHFGKVIHAAQQAGAEVQHVEKIVKEFKK